MNNVPGMRAKPRRRSSLAVMTSLFLIFILAGNSRSAHQVNRPVSNDDGQINQTYLWAEEFGTQLHRGLDFRNLLGTEVYAVADGIVIDMYEAVPDGTYPLNTPKWGNFVLIRHNALLNHYDQISDTTAYTYTIYAHLRQVSVIPSVGDNVTAGSHIANIDSTGNSTGNHLHFQVVLNPSTDLDNIRLYPTNTLDSENRSRNPELWLAPLPGTGTAIGKVSDANGDPVPNLVVCGMVKNTAGYTSSRTYSFAWANPDDIFHENFGTTDVRPGTYSIYAANLATGCGGAHVYDLGNHTFMAGRVTSIGLYPVWLPVVRPANADWDPEMFIRNHDSTGRNVSYTTYIYPPASYLFSGQRTRSINPRGMAVIADEPTKSYSGIVVPNRDSSVVIISKLNGQPAGYTAITAANGLGSAGWERGGNTLYVPLVKDRWNNRSSEIYVTNLGAADTRINVTFFNQAGVDYQGPQNLVVRPNQRTALNPPGYVPTNGYYSAWIRNSTGYNQPLAAVVLETGEISSSVWPTEYAAFSSGGINLFAPMVKKNFNNGTTGITLQNTTAFTATFEARYYDMSGNQQGQTVAGTIAPYSPYVLYNPSQIPDGFLGSIRVTSTGNPPQNLVGQMSEARTTGTITQMTSNLALGGTTTIHLPVWYDNYTAEGGNWTSGVNVQNADGGTNTIAATWYNQAGSQVLTQTATLSTTYDTHNFFDTSLSNFVGSVVIQSTSGKDIVAVSNVVNYAAASGADTAMAFNGSNR